MRLRLMAKPEARQKNQRPKIPYLILETEDAPRKETYDGIRKQEPRLIIIGEVETRYVEQQLRESSWVFRWMYKGAYADEYRQRQPKANVKL